jgi:arylsulfatase A-like enzyme
MAGAAALFPFSFQKCAQEQRRPNVIHILIDDMGYGDLGCYGNTFHETPHIDQLASDGMKFTNAYAAAPNCSPTRASILTGQWPARLGITQYLHGNKNAPRMQKKPMIQPDLPPGLPLDTITIAEAVKDHGYATASIGKWHLGGEQYLPENHGFDYTFAGGDYGHHQTMFSPFEIPVIPDTEPGKYLTDYLTDKAEEFIEANQDTPFFMYLSLYAVHSPIQAKEELIEKYREKLKNGEEGDPVYAAMVEGVDICVKRVRQKLQDLNLAEDTIIMFFSDNGGVPSRASNGPLRSGKGYLYEGGIREPLIVHWPGVTEPGSVNDALVTSTDFYPTIMEMITGTEQSGSTDGQTIVPLLRGENDIPRDTLYWHYPHYSNAGSPPCSAIRENEYKLIEFHEDESLELYNLTEDIDESNNLAEDMPDLASRLYEKLQSWRDELDVKMPWPNPDYDPSNTG